MLLIEFTILFVESTFILLSYTFNNKKLQFRYKALLIQCAHMQI